MSIRSKYRFKHQLCWSYHIYCIEAQPPRTYTVLCSSLRIHFFRVYLSSLAFVSCQRPFAKLSFAFLWGWTRICSHVLSWASWRQGPCCTHRCHSCQWYLWSRQLKVYRIHARFSICSVLRNFYRFSLDLWDLSPF